MSEPLLLLERDDEVVTLTFNDPDRRNAMTQAMGEAFADTIAWVMALSLSGWLKVKVTTSPSRVWRMRSSVLMGAGD